MMLQQFIKRGLVSAALWIIVFLPQGGVSSMQPTQSAKCKPFNTIYPNLESGWHWLTPDQLVFSVNDGLPADAIGKSPSQWYQYQPSSDKLDRLTASPFNTPKVPANTLTKLKNLQPDKQGNYQAIKSSKGGDKFIYPRKVDAETDYWFTDTKTGAEANLGKAKATLEVFLLPDENQFIVQNGPNSVAPILWVSQDGQKITTKRLDTLPGINRGYRDSGLVVSGISPSGHYLLIQPEA